jgi:hypothetical protein
MSALIGWLAVWLLTAALLGVAIGKFIKAGDR